MWAMLSGVVMVCIITTVAVAEQAGPFGLTVGKSTYAEVKDIIKQKNGVILDEHRPKIDSFYSDRRHIPDIENPYERVIIAKGLDEHPLGGSSVIFSFFEDILYKIYMWAESNDIFQPTYENLVSKYGFPDSQGDIGTYSEYAEWKEDDISINLDKFNNPTLTYINNKLKAKAEARIKVYIQESPRR